MRHGPAAARHYAGLLRACCRTADLAQGKRVHQEIAGHGDGLEALLGDRLVEMYAKCGGIQAAKQAFDSLPRKGVLAWSFLIAGYAQNGQAEAAIAAFHTMRTVLEPDGYTFVSVLGAVSSLGSRELATGLRLHALLSLGGFGKGLVVQNALVNMYAKCGSLDRAKRVFEAMNTRNVVSWTCLIAAYAQNGHAPEALELYNAMDAEPNGATFATALSACASVGAAALLQGRQIHARITASRTQQPLNVQNALVTMYAKCGCLDRAAELFAGMARKDVTSWNAMMSAYAHNGQAEKALELYKNGGPEEPNAFTFSILLGACASLKLLDEGKAVHAAFSRRLGSNTVVENGLISMYAKCGELGLARKAFDGMANSRRDAGSWNAMMAAYAQHGHPEQALRLFKDMQERPNAFTFCTALSACGALKALEDGKAVHGRLLGCADQDEVLLTTAVQNALLDMYVKCGCLGAAFRVFEGIRHKDRVSWTCIISACNQHRCHDKAFELLEDMIQHDVRPDEITYTGILAACSRLQQGQQLHLRIASQGLEANALVQSSLINMYSRCGSLEHARSVFQQASSSTTSDLVTWTSMMVAYVHFERYSEALDLFHQMELELQPDSNAYAVALDACSNLGALREGKRIHGRLASTDMLGNRFVRNALVHLYAKCGHLQEARELFEDGSYSKDPIIWTTMLAGYAQHGYASEALDLYQQMDLEGIPPDQITFFSLLSACSRRGMLRDGLKSFHSMSMDHFLAPKVEHFVCMVDVLGRAGRLDDAEELLAAMPYQPEVAAWMCLLAASKLHSDSARAKRAAEHISKLDPVNTAPYVLRLLGKV